MTVALLDTRVVLLDIEGTTTPIAFVRDVLFPFARGRVLAYLERERGSEACRAAVLLLRDEQAADRARGERPPRDPAPGSVPGPAPGDESQELGPASIAAYARWLMDLDRKSRGLKLLQGLIWQDGYRSGELHGEVYEDVAPALDRWRTLGLRTYIFSSGSVLAQRSLFQTTGGGDLTVLLDGYFDTVVGPKGSADSYRAILKALGVAPDQVLFVSDAVAELDAARAAGLRTALCERGTSTSGPVGGHPVIHTFDEVA